MMFIILALASLAGFLFLTFRPPGESRNAVNPAEATMMINRENAVVIDVRETDQYVTGHVPDSRNIPEARLEERAADLQKLKHFPLILVCQSGPRSAAACTLLEKKGFPNVRNLAGGIGAWKEAGLPLKKGAKR